MKTLRMRGQAFVVFKDIASASNAIRAMQQFPFYDKPMKIQYAKAKSDVVAKLDGTFKPREKKKKVEKRKAESDQAEVSKRAKKEDVKGADKKKKADESHLQPKQAPPNKILFVENLPPETTDMMLQMLFQQFPGFKEVRLVKGKSVVAFVEYESEMNAGVAMTSLQHFKVNATNLMVISFAKRG